MTNRVTLMVGAGVTAALAACTMLVAANWLSESAVPVILAHRSIFAAAGPTMGILGSFAAIFFAYRQRPATPEKPMKPRIRNGLIG